MLDKLDYTSRLYGRRMVKLIKQRIKDDNPTFRQCGEEGIRTIWGVRLCHDNTILYQHYPTVRSEWTIGRRDFMEIVDKNGDPVEADRTVPKNYRE